MAMSRNWFDVEPGPCKMGAGNNRNLGLTSLAVSWGDFQINTPCIIPLRGRRVASTMRYSLGKN